MAKKIIDPTEIAKSISELGKAASKAGEEWAKEFKNLSPEERKKHREAENQLQSRMDKTNYYWYMDTVSYISKETPYSEEEILQFMAVTGYKTHEIEFVLLQFSRAGIGSLQTVIMLAKLGHFKRQD